jgi:anti-sigma regulatory factor (Ser/Thr protein kinase)
LVHADEDGADVLFQSEFDHGGMTWIRHAVAGSLRAIGVPEGSIDDVLIAVGEVVGNVIRHGGGAGEIRLTRAGRRLRCDVADRGPGLGDGPHEPLEPAPPEALHGRGLWLVFALCTVVELDSSPQGTRVSLVIDLPEDPNSTHFDESLHTGK